MNMITQAIELFLQSTCTILASATLTDFGSKMAQVFTAGHTMMLTAVVALLQDMDDTIAQDAQRRNEWEVVRKDKRTLVTSFGELCFERRYYRHRQGGERAYLLDVHLGIQANAKVNGDVRQKAITLAEQGSYSKSAAGATVSEISRMSVCNYVGHLGRFPALEPLGERRAVKWLYVEADEDHVSLQNGKKTHVKLVYVHEGVEERGERRMLINPRYLTWPCGYDSNLLWKTVSDYIERQYVSESIEHIFLSGDCASWIRTGEDCLYPCVPILDSFHTMKGLRKLCGGKQEQMAAFLRHVRKDERKQASDLCKSILKETPEPNRKARLKQANYLLSNWERIRNQRHIGALSCSAEGHISHILSERLSSRPLGWSQRNMENIAQLRVMRANGQVIQYEELRLAKARKETADTGSKAAALVRTSGIRKALKRSTHSTLKTTVQNLPVLKNGARTPLFQALHGLSFDYVAC